MLLGDVTIENQSLAAYKQISSYHKSKEDYENKVKNSVDWTISELDIKQDHDQPINLSRKFKIEHVDDFEGSGMLYLNPVLFTNLTENPFKLEERVFPVDYPCPENSTYMCTFEVPNGYLVEELPESQIMGMPNKAGSFRYSVSQNGGKVTVTIQHKINQKVFTQLEYPNLREFYNRVVSKCSEQIVLKRKS
jgi:uncharacterized protein DUF3858